jgi:hypothetical protein
MTRPASGPGSRYVEVPAQAIEDFLQSKGFTRTTQRNEVVYVRSHHEWPCVKVKVYTSIRDGHTSVRKRGADAIKVCTVYEGKKRKPFGIGRFPHVLRTGNTQAVLDRMYDRMRAAYRRANEWVAKTQVKQVMES